MPPSVRVQELRDRAEAGEDAYQVDGTRVSIVFRDTIPDGLWGTVYDIDFKLADSGWSPSCAATFVLDIAEDEEISPASSSPWAGWIGWYHEEMVVAWVNPEVGYAGAKTLPMPFQIEEEPTDQQWVELARIVTAACFWSGSEDE